MPGGSWHPQLSAEISKMRATGLWREIVHLTFNEAVDVLIVLIVLSRSHCRLVRSALWIDSFVHRLCDVRPQWRRCGHVNAQPWH
jgi:hypothetical protein